jgi:hypothetical protein
MRRVISSFLMLASVFLTCAARAQDTNSATATCNFDEEKQLVVEYQHVSFNLKRPLASQLAFGKVWAPGGKPMTFFTNTPVQIGGRDLGIGAYTLFVIPTSKQWTLIVSKSTDMSGTYDEQQDVVRVPMDSGELPNPEAEFTAAFGHVAPGQCNLRLDLDKYGRFVSFQKK